MLSILLFDAGQVLAQAERFEITSSKAIRPTPVNTITALRATDIVRLRIVRAHLREVPPALKVGSFANARTSFQAFEDNRDGSEDLIKARNNGPYVAIEKGMIDIEKALKPDKPDAPQVTRYGQ